MVLSQGAPLRKPQRRRLPALSFWPGQRPAQATSCAAVAKRLMSGPISDKMLSPDSSLTPGIVTSKWIRERNPGLGAIVGQALQARLGFAVDLGNGRRQGVDLLQMKLEQEPMMVGEPAMQRIVEFLGRGLQSSIGQGDELFGVSLTGDHRFDHPPAVDPHNVADHQVEANIGFGQRLLDALDVAGLFAQQLLAGSHRSTGSGRPGSAIRA